MSLKNGDGLFEFTVPSYNSISTLPIGNLPAAGFEAMGFRFTDNFLYALNNQNKHLYKIGQDAVSQDLGAVGLDQSLKYLAGDISPNGRYYYSIGSDISGVDIHLAKTDLETPGFPTQFIPINGSGHLSDIAFDPMNSRLYGFDQANQRMVSLDLSSGSSTTFQGISPGNNIYGLYFDAFGDLYGIGSSLSGVVDALFLMDKLTGKETRLTTGASSSIADVASCPFSVEMKSEVTPGNNLPCTEAIFSYTLANRSGETISGVEFQHRLPSGFQFVEVVSNGFGGSPDTMSIPGTLRLQNLNFSPGTRSLSIKVGVGNIPKGRYNSQPLLKNLPDLYGVSCLSNAVKSPGFEDSTSFIVNRFDADSLYFKYLLCHGESLLLQSAAYSDHVQWNNGSAATSLEVTQGGWYSFVAGSACESIVVNNDVTSTNCPFTISVEHQFVPDTIFPCNEVLLSFVINNDTGEPRSGIAFMDTLPAQFKVIGLIKNSYGGFLDASAPPNIIHIQGMTLHPGKDSLQILVRVEDIPPGIYKNRAVLSGLPLVLGPIRLSDDPATFGIDSSKLYIRGTLADSTEFEQLICEGESIVLNASNLGTTFLWEDGRTSPFLEIDEPGRYLLQIFDGCTPSLVSWNILPGSGISIDKIGPYQIHQGETISLAPQVLNEGDSLYFNWSASGQANFSCQYCLETTVTPLGDVLLGFNVSNEVCGDSIVIRVEVDQNRRIYAPNIFSPNDDGVNDLFYLQSPDYGKIKHMAIFDRWGNILFEAKETLLEFDMPSWDGRFNHCFVLPGVYFWKAELEFIDGQRQVFSGDISVFR